MTQLYAHLRDEALRRASELARNLVEQCSPMSAEGDNATPRTSGVQGEFGGRK
jgi:hypothetical protein